MGTQNPLSLYAALGAQLDTIQTAYEQLLKLAEEKQGALISGGDYNAIADITAREQKQADAAAELEKERMHIVADIAALHKINAGTVTVSAIAKLAGGPDEVKLRAQAESLLQSLMKLRDQNAVNRQLIEMKMSYNAFMMDAFSHQQNGPSNLYGANGQEDAFEGDIHRILDSEA